MNKIDDVFAQINQPENTISFHGGYLKDNGEMRILYVMPGQRGDVLVSSAVISGIAKEWPNADIYFATKPEHFDILYGHPNIVDFIEYDKKMDNQRYTQGWIDGKGPFDICFTPYLLTQRAGLNYSPNVLHNDHVGNLHGVYANSCNVQLGEPYIHIANLDQASLKLHQILQVVQQVKAVNILCVGIHGKSYYQSKDYDRMYEFATIVSDNILLFQFGADNDQRIQDAIDCRGLPFGEMTHVMKNLDAFVGVDSFPLHAASMVGTPWIGLYSSTFPRYSMPYAKTYMCQQIIANRRKCNVPCHQSKCVRAKDDETINKNCCNDIQPILIFETLNKILDGVSNYV